LGDGRHSLAQSVAYGDLGNEKPALSFGPWPITPAYEQQADPAIELQLEKAGGQGWRMS